MSERHYHIRLRSWPINNLREYSLTYVRCTGCTMVSAIEREQVAIVNSKQAATILVDLATDENIFSVFSEVTVLLQATTQSPTYDERSCNELCDGPPACTLHAVSVRPRYEQCTRYSS